MIEPGRSSCPAAVFFKVNIMFFYFSLLNIGNKKVMVIVIHIGKWVYVGDNLLCKIAPNFYKNIIEIIRYFK